MKVLYDSGIDKTLFERGSVVILGSFDGFHLGHMRLIELGLEEAAGADLCSVVYTYANHPSDVLDPSGKLKMLISNETKIQILNRQKTDVLVLETFDEQFRHIEPKDFISKILVGRLNVKIVIVGENHRFGYLGRGTSRMLIDEGKRAGYRVAEVNSVCHNGRIISSSVIRDSLALGDLDTVNQMLGRYFSVRGTVDFGKRLGGIMGFPTANIYPYKQQALPAYGVYATCVYLDGKVYNGVTNVGENPTVDEGNMPKVETHLLNFDNYIYGQVIEVEFIKRIREERKFDDVNELFEQIGRDVGAVKSFFLTDYSAEGRGKYEFFRKE